MLSNEEMDLGNTLKANLEQIPQLKHQFNLILGSDCVGKSSLFNASQLDIIQTTTNGDIEINSWHDEEAVFLELPEKILSSPPLLKVFLKQIKKYTRTKNINGIILCLDIYSAMQESPKAFVLYLKNWASNLTTITKTYSQLIPLHLVFTHMDKVAGFCHSFDESHGPWGYLFSPYINHASLLKQNSNNNDLLLKNLHGSLLVKLHKTEDKLTRYLIREFPLQMESIGNLVNACVNHLSIESFQTMGVYFTCAKQSNSAHDRLTTNISETYSLSLKNQVPQSSLDKSYFIDGMIKQIKLTPSKKQKQHSPLKSKYAAAFAGLLLVGLSTHHYITNRHMTNAYQELTQYQQSSKDSFDELLPALEHLSKANQSLDKMHGTLSLDHLALLNDQIKKQYESGINETFIPELAKQLTDVLIQSKEPADIYRALKAYLMLGNAKHLEKNYLIHWFTAFWKKHELSNPNAFASLLNEALSNPFKTIQLNDNLVEASRNYLLALPQSYLYFQLIEAYLPKETTRIPIENFTLSELLIPTFYEKTQVNSIYQERLPQISKQFEQDHYVLNNKDSKVSRIIKEAYLKNYYLFWQQIMTKVKPKSFQNYSMGAHIFNSLAKNNSSLEQLLSLIQKNTHAFINPKTMLEKQFNHQIASHFTSTNLLSATQIQSLRPLFLELTQYFETLSNSDNQLQTAFDMSKRRFEQSNSDPLSRLMRLEKQLPEPLNRWSKSLATNAWYLLLQNAQIHVNQEWQNLVYHDYKTAIYDHFPFSSNENKEVSPEVFKDFFGHNGKLAHFFENYLSPFIDTTTARWDPKIKDGLQLPIHKDTIKELIRANLIKEMFFKYNNEQPSIKFTLHALELEPIIQDLTITMNGQKLIETQENKRSLEFQWPGNNPKFATELNVSNISGESFSKTEGGYWSWFKLLKKSSLQPYGDDMTNFQLTLNVEGNASRFLMITGTQMNPFIPGLLEHFSLPDKIA